MRKYPSEQKEDFPKSVSASDLVRFYFKRGELHYEIDTNLKWEGGHGSEGKLLCKICTFPFTEVITGPSQITKSIHDIVLLQRPVTSPSYEKDTKLSVVPFSKCS